MSHLIKYSNMIPERLFDGFLPSLSDLIIRDLTGSTNHADVRYNISKHEGGYEFNFELPGFNKDEITLYAEDNMLHLEAEKNNEGKVNFIKGTTIAQERRISLNIPRNSLISEARLENGVLNVKLVYKSSEESRKKIDIL